VLISRTLNKSKSWVLAHGEYRLIPEEIQKLEDKFNKYLQGVPLPYLLGEWDFYGRRFLVTPEVLIPRPETELLVELAAAFGKQKESLSIIDVGTGSGVIAVSLAAELPGARVIATDISMEALKIARKNAQIHQQERITFIQSHLMAPFNAQFDLICANLPYIPSRMLENLEVAKWEPQLALDGGESGLDLIERILVQAKMNLTHGGMILLEIESCLGRESLDRAKRILPEAKHRLHQDLSGKNRVLEIQLP
jgi:release factor glutamine methyltransferase